MKRYIEHVQGKPSHERRQHAAQLAGALTGVVVLLWAATLGLRLGSGTGVVATDSMPDPDSGYQAAAAVYAVPTDENTLVAATSTDWTPINESF